MIRFSWLLVAVAALSFQQSYCQTLTWKPIAPATEASFRGLSVVDDHTVWIGGSKGTIGRSVDGGTSWVFQKIPGFDNLDFRSVFGFDSLRAVIANAGSPAYIFMTHNGGKTWQPVYTNRDSAAFLDGIDFWDNQHGIAFGDPIKNKMLVLCTLDGGETWKPVSDPPKLENGEASFAASGTTIRCTGKEDAWIATGGKVSRLWHSKDRGKHWDVQLLPILQGSNGTGAFSFFIGQNQKAILVGGDYEQDTLRKKHVFYSDDGAKTWKSPLVPTRGYRECVESLTSNLLVALGPGGIDFSRDSGKSWLAFSDERGFHVFRKARRGKLVVAAGGKGKIALVEY